MATTTAILDIDAMHLPLQTEFLFNEDNPNWNDSTSDSNRDYNETFIRMVLRFQQDVVYTRGYVFLNEVLHSLGFEQYAAGQLIGWVTSGKTLDYEIDAVDGGLLVRFLNVDFILKSFKNGENH